MAKNSRPPVAQTQPPEQPAEVVEQPASQPEDVPPEPAPQPPEPPAAPPAPIKVRVLRDGSYGKCNEVVLMDAELAASLAGEVDAEPEAVAYAESLAQ
jgi:hypothetical protein